jgi:translation elongation factor EF-Ts
MRAYKFRQVSVDGSEHRILFGMRRLVKRNANASGACRLGVLVEVNCETDFVARGDKFKELVADVAMQIAASADVTVVAVEDVPVAVVQKETDIEMGKEDIQSKPEQIR